MVCSAPLTLVEPLLAAIWACEPVHKKKKNDERVISSHADAERMCYLVIGRNLGGALKNNFMAQPQAT